MNNQDQSTPDGYKLVECYSIGPFTIDPESRTLTLASGVYTLRRPIVFGLTPLTVVSDVEYRSLPQAGDEA